MWVFESCGYVFSKLKFCGYLNLWVFKNCGYSNLWVHKICDDTKFQVNGREYQNICVLCISCEQKNICAFFHICFLPYVQNMPCELAFRFNSKAGIYKLIRHFVVHMHYSFGHYKQLVHLSLALLDTGTPIRLCYRVG